MNMLVTGKGPYVGALLTCACCPLGPREWAWLSSARHSIYYWATFPLRKTDSKDSRPSYPIRLANPTSF